MGSKLKKWATDPCGPDFWGCKIAHTPPILFWARGNCPKAGPSRGVTTVIPVIIGATGIVTRSLRKNLEAILGKHSIDSLQKTVVLGTSHIIRKVLQCET